MKRSLFVIALLASGCSVTLLKKDRTLEIVQALVPKEAPTPVPTPVPSPAPTPPLCLATDGVTVTTCKDIR